MRKVYADVTVRLAINMEDGVEFSDVISEMDYDFTSLTEGAEIIDTEITDAEVKG